MIADVWSTNREAGFKTLEWRCFAKQRLRVLQCFLVSSFTWLGVMCLIFMTGSRNIPNSSPSPISFDLFNPALYYSFMIHHKTHFKPSSILPENSCVLRRMVDHGNDGVVAPNVEVPSLLEKGHVVPLLCHPEGNVRAWNSICNGQVARFQHKYPFIFITPASSMSSIANWHTHVLKLQLLWQTHRFEFISSCICTNELLEVWNRLMIDNCDSYWLRI